MRGRHRHHPQPQFQRFESGEGEIRTRGRLAPTLVFETSTIDHSVTSPVVQILNFRARYSKVFANWMTQSKWTIVPGLVPNGLPIAEIACRTSIPPDPVSRISTGPILSSPLFPPKPDGVLP